MSLSSSSQMIRESASNRDSETNSRADRENGAQVRRLFDKRDRPTHQRRGDNDLRSLMVVLDFFLSLPS
jgi:hypothetical protein